MSRPSASTDRRGGEDDRSSPCPRLSGSRSPLRRRSSSLPRTPPPASPPAPNPVACENEKPGTRAERLAGHGAGDSTIQGYATSMSVNKRRARSASRSRPRLRVPHRHLPAGLLPGQRRAAAGREHPAHARACPQTQPACLTHASTGLIDCGNWGVSASWTVPAAAVSGVYIARLVRNDTGGASQIPFVVRDDAAHSDDAAADLRRDLAGLQRVRRQQPLLVHVACPPGNPHAYKGAF